MLADASPDMHPTQHADMPAALLRRSRCPCASAASTCCTHHLPLLPTQDSAGARHLPVLQQPAAAPAPTAHAYLPYSHLHAHCTSKPGSRFQLTTAHRCRGVHANKATPMEGRRLVVRVRELTCQRKDAASPSTGLARTFDTTHKREAQPRSAPGRLVAPGQARVGSLERVLQGPQRNTSVALCCAVAAASLYSSIQQETRRHSHGPTA